MADRLSFTFEVPPTIDAPFKSISLRMNTVTEEQDAYARVNNSPVRAIGEQIKASLVSYTDGKGELRKLSLADGSADTFYSSVEGPARELLALAWSEINSAKEDDKKAFLKTKKVSV